MGWCRSPDPDQRLAAQQPVTHPDGVLRTQPGEDPGNPAVLSRLADIGLGSLSLGPPLTLAIHMAEKGGVSVLDEPTSSLPLASVERLLGLLDRLVAPGTSVIVITYHATAVELETVLRV